MKIAQEKDDNLRPNLNQNRKIYQHTVRILILGIVGQSI